MKFTKPHHYALGVFIVLGLAVAFMSIIGLVSPKKFYGTQSIVLASPIQEVWQQLLDLDHLPARRFDIQRVEIIGTSEEGYRQWKEYMKNGGYALLQTTDQVSEERLTNAMVASSFGEVGTWTYVLEPTTPTSTRLTITEDRTTTNLFRRAFLTFVGPSSHLDAEIASFKKSTR